MDYQIERVQGGAVFRLSRPAKLNSSTPEIWHGFSSLLNELEKSSARFLVITGEGQKAFCAGTDLGNTPDLSAADIADRCDYAREQLMRLWRSPLISVAALNGLAYGGGLELASACMFRVAAPHVRLSVPEVKLAAMPAYGGTQFLTSLLGAHVALDLLLTGRTVEVEEALRMGLISRVIDADKDVVEAALELARSIAQFSFPAISAIREAVAAAGPQPTDEGMAREGLLARELFAGEDCREGVAAFLEKRTPKFTGR